MKPNVFDYLLDHLQKLSISYQVEDDLPFLMDFIDPLISRFKGYYSLEKIMFMAWIFVLRWS